MVKLLLATHNPDKIREIKCLLDGVFDFQVLSLEDLPDMPEVIEDATMLEGNAIKKAREIFAYAKTRFSPIVVLADDTGLEVDALNGRPGVYSARYAQDVSGRKPTYQENIVKLLSDLKEHPSRRARFRTVIAIVGDAFGAYVEETFEGTLNGEILLNPRGENGFGYDPIFLIPPLQRTLAELSLEEKNQISHRGNSLRRVTDWLNQSFRVSTML